MANFWSGKQQKNVGRFSPVGSLSAPTNLSRKPTRTKTMEPSRARMAPQPAVGIPLRCRNCVTKQGSAGVVPANTARKSPVARPPRADPAESVAKAIIPPPTVSASRDPVRNNEPAIKAAVPHCTKAATLKIALIAPVRARVAMKSVKLRTRRRRHAVSPTVTTITRPRAHAIGATNVPK